jgi:bifunctional non-homologous end joining protein LigD
MFFTYQKETYKVNEYETLYKGICPSVNLFTYRKGRLMSPKKVIRLDPRWMTKKTKVLFPQDGITKEEMASYYERVAPFMLPYTRNRPLAMLRYPDGIDHQSFYQKDIPDYFPDWIDRYAITNKDGSQTTYVICQNKETLIYLAYQACITPHLWLSRIDKLHYPDRMIFDLDPGENSTFDDIRNTALACKDILDSLGIVAFAMTTGSRGMHVVIPLRRLYTFATVHAYSHKIAQMLINQNPQKLTIDIRKEERHGRLFIDCLRNTYGHHAVSPYAVRALPTAPVATPLAWEEVRDKKLTARTYTLRNLFDRLDHAGNAWADFFHHKNTLKAKLP